jgi:type IV pilus assembly protein PilV
MKSRIQLSGQSQTGAALLEAMLAILIFSLGILTVIGIQAASIRMVTDAQYRSRASLLADRLIGEMWASGQSIETLQTNFGAEGSKYLEWLSDVQDPAKGGLPGVVAPVEDSEDSEGGDSGTLPVVTITPLPRPAGTGAGGALVGDVSITLFWRTPSMSAGEKRQHTSISQISRNP